MSPTLEYRRIFPNPPDHDDGKIFNRKYVFQVQLTWEDQSRFIVPSYQMGVGTAFRTAFDRKKVWPHDKKIQQAALNALHSGRIPLDLLEVFEAYEQHIRPVDKDVIACLIQNTHTYEEYLDVDDFASELGFTNPTKALAAWEECRRVHREFVKHRGIDFCETLMEEFGLTHDDL